MRDSDTDPKVRPFRTRNRYFCQNGKWWFSTREGEEGPFNSREHAEQGMARYVDSVAAMRKVKAEKIERQAVALEHRPDPTIWHQHIDSI